MEKESIMRDINFVFKRNGTALIKKTAVPKEEGLYIKVTIHEGNISQIHFTWKTEKEEISGKVDSFLDQINFKVANKYSDNTVCLLQSLGNYMETIPEGDIWNASLIIPGERELPQHFVDSFVCYISGYISAIYLLKKYISWEEIPFPISFPFSEIDVNILSGGLFEYLRIPLQGLIMSRYSGPEIILFSLCNDFINLWDSFFDMGEKFNTEKLTLDISRGYFELCVNMLKVFGEGMEKKFGTIEKKFGEVEKKLETIDKELIFLRDVTNDVYSRPYQRTS